jgi:hypothetical protein
MMYTLRPLTKTKDVLVYVKADIPVAQHVRELWQAICVGDDHAHEGDAHMDACDADQPHATVVCHDVPPVAARQRGRPSTRRVPPLPNGAQDLVAAVVSPLNLPTAAERAMAIARLDNEFVRNMQHWSVL